MAIVPNKDGQGIKANGHTTGDVDVSYCTPTAFGAGIPSTAGYASELRADTATGDLYRNLASGQVKWVDAQ
jgi:hypothetical protein